MVHLRMLGVVLVGLCALGASALPTPGDFEITELLPGLPKMPSFKQYSGYMPLEDTSGTELFFWFVESQRSPSTDPIMVWFNGGPGASSIMYGFWTEHGPFRLTDDKGSVEFYDQAWNKIANVIYVEAPSGVGFSRSADRAHYHTNDTQTARDNFRFLQQFFEVFPMYKTNPFWVTGESYGGHYVPDLATQIMDHDFDKVVNMQGFFVGNPGINSDWFFNVNEYAFITQLWSHAFIPSDAYFKSQAACGWNEFFSDCSKNFTSPSSECLAATKAALKYLPNKGWDPYDLLAPVCHTSTSDKDAAFRRQAARALTPKYVDYLDSIGMNPNAYNPCMQNWVPTYMNRADVQKVIHAKPTAGLMWPNPVKGWDYSAQAEYNDVATLFPAMFKNRPNWKIMIYSGTADAAVPFEGTERWINCLVRQEKVPVKNDWKPWFSKAGNHAGDIKQWERISFVTIKGCGHMVPMYCPKLGFEFYQNWLTQWS